MPARRVTALLAALLLMPASPTLAQAAGAAKAAPLPDQAIDTLALRAWTRFLADDLLEGRGTGTRGAHIAALYLQSELMRMGLRGTATDGGYLQSIPMREAVVDTAASSLTLRRSGAISRFGTPDAFLLNTGGAGAFHSFSGDVVFAGSPRFAADALRGMNLRGRVVAVNGPLGAAALALVPDWIRRGVSGVLLLIPQPERYRLYARSRGPSRFYVDAPVADPVWQPDLPVLLAGPDLSRALLAGTGMLPDAAPDSGFAAVDLGARIEAAVKVDVRSRSSANVAGVVVGSDPALRDEYVVYTAHYDHLGISLPDARGDSVYNGFSDNAAGSAMLLAIAQDMVRNPPRRSVLFLFVTGEERGLLGSSYYAAAPLIPLARTVADINLDAGAPPVAPLDWHLAGAATSSLGEVGRKVAERYGWTAEASPPSPNSDYWPFLARGVPALFLIPGSHWEGVDKAEHDRLFRRWDHYHQAADEWKPDFPFAGLARYAGLALAIGRDVADADARPRQTGPAAHRP